MGFRICGAMLIQKIRNELHDIFTAWAQEIKYQNAHCNISTQYRKGLLYGIGFGEYRTIRTFNDWLYEYWPVIGVAFIFFAIGFSLGFLICLIGV